MRLIYHESGRPFPSSHCPQLCPGLSAKGSLSHSGNSSQLHFGHFQNIG